MLVTVSKGSTYVPVCIDLLPALVLQFETLRAPRIILEVERAMEEVSFMSCSPSDEFLDPIFEKEDLIEGFKTIWFLL